MTCYKTAIVERGVGVRYVSAGDGGIGTMSKVQSASQRLWSYSLERTNAMLCGKNDSCEKKDQKVSRDKEYRPERGMDRCRCVSLYTPDCSETQVCKSYIPCSHHPQNEFHPGSKTGQVTGWAGVHCTRWEEPNANP